VPDAVGYGVEHGAIQMFLAALARRNASDDGGSVGDGLLGVESSLFAGEALDQHARFFVDEDAHAANLTTFSAASRMPSAIVKFNPESLRICRPSSTLVPSIRTTTGCLTLNSRAAAKLSAQDVCQLVQRFVFNPSQPVNQGTVLAGWNVETLFPYGDNLFVGTTTGVSIYNNSNPSSPSLISTITHVTGCDPVVVQGDYAYCTIHAGNFCGQAFNELNVINVGNVYSPFISQTYNLTSPYGLGIDGNQLFVCDDASGLKVYDAGDPNNLKLKNTVSAGTTRDVIAISGWLLLVSVEGIYQFNYTEGDLTQLSFLPVHHP
jgi:hypothetical protein